MDSPQSSNISRFLRLIDGYLSTSLIYVAAELRIADLLQDGPKDIAYLAQKTGTHEQILHRVLRALSSMRVFRESERGFELTGLSECLLSDSPYSLLPSALYAGEEAHWRPWGELLHVVKTGETPFEKVFGTDFFTYYSAHPHSSEIFDNYMDVVTKHIIGIILANYDFSPYKVIVDVGGGFGSLLFSILAKHKDIRGILYDLPHVVQGAYPLRKERQVEERCEIVGGQFFDSVPEGGDLYLLKSILHDWPDEKAIAILNNCFEAMESKSKLLVLERIIQDDVNSHEGSVLDIFMMVHTGGKERTREEYSQLFQSAGFRLSNVVPLGIDCNAIEGIRE